MMFMTLDGAMDNFFYKPSSPYIAKGGNQPIQTLILGILYYYSSLGENLFTVLITTKNTMVNSSTRTT